jgi:hypothetical protein
MYILEINAFLFVRTSYHSSSDRQFETYGIENMHYPCHKLNNDCVESDRV